MTVFFSNFSDCRRTSTHVPAALIYFLSLTTKMEILIETPMYTYYRGKSIRKLTAAINKTLDNRRKLWPQGFSYATHHSKNKMYKGHVMHTFDTEDELENYLLDHAIQTVPA
jgi:hypothetical protein